MHPERHASLPRTPRLPFKLDSDISTEGVMSLQQKPGLCFGGYRIHTQPLRGNGGNKYIKHNIHGVNRRRANY